MKPSTQTEVLSRKIAERLADCLVSSSRCVSLDQDKAAEIVSSELAEREKEIRAEAIEECAKIAEKEIGSTRHEIAAVIRRSLSRKQE